MRLYEILTEARDAPLYHWMDKAKSLNVFMNDTMPANWTHRLPTDPTKQIAGNSFTRDKNLQWGTSMAVRLIINQQRLAQTNRIIPVDGHYVYGHTQDTWDRKELGQRQEPHATGSQCQPE